MLYIYLFFVKWLSTVYYDLFFLVPDEESTIEEQEATEGEADHKAELVDLAKDGT